MDIYHAYVIHGRGGVGSSVLRRKLLWVFLSDATSDATSAVAVDVSASNLELSLESCKCTALIANVVSDV